MNLINKPLILVLILVSVIFGANGDEISTTVTTSGSFQKNGYMNVHTTSFDFTITISGADDTTYAGGDYLPYVIFNNSGSPTIISDNTNWSVISASPVNQITFSITDDNIEASSGWPGDGGQVDFQVRFRDLNGANNIYKDVTLAGSASLLQIDQDPPYYPLIEPDGGEYTKNSNFLIRTDETTDSLRAQWTNENDNSVQSEVITQSINLGYTTITEHSNSINLTEGVTYSLNVQIFDNAHNRYSATHNNIGVDLTDPAISTITSTADPGTYKIGDMIPFTITFNDYVYPYNGSLSVTFNTTNDTTATSGSDAWAQYGSTYYKKWSGQYRVQENDDVATLSVSSVTMNSGTLYDKTYSTGGDVLTPNSMTVPVTSTSFTTNINDGVALQLDGVRPTISSITTSSGDGSYSVDENVNITVNFSESVSLSSGNLKITLETGDQDNTLNIPAADISSTTTAIGTYTVVAGDVSSDLSVKSIELTGGGTLSDAAGNAMTSFTIGTNLDVDYDIVLETTAPVIGTITSSISTNNESYGIGSSIPITLNFINGSGGSAEAVTLSTGSMDLTLDTGDNISTASISNSTSASFTYTVSEGDASNDLDVSSVAISGGGSITDLAGNALSDFSISTGLNLSDNNNIIIEATRPTITAVTTTAGNITYKAGDNIDLTVQFSESVKLTGGTLDLTLETGDNDQVVSISAFTSNSATATYTVQEGDTTNDLSVSTIALSSNTTTLTDVVDNNPNALTDFTPATTLASAHALVIDGVLPTITKVTSTSSNGSYGVGDTVNITVYFSEAVTLSGGNLVITLETGSPKQTVTISTISGAGSASGTYTVQTNDVSSDLSVNSIALSGSGKLSDANGNEMTDFSIPANNDISDLKDIVIDGTAPGGFTTGAITTVASVSTFIVSRYWNEMNTSVDVTVPIASDNSLVGGTVQIQAKINENSYVDVGALETIQSSDVTNATMDIRIDKSGNSSITDLEELTGFANGGVITFNAILTDLAGNSTPGTASSTTLTIDTTAATVTNVTSTANDAIYKTGDDIPVDITFSDAVTLTGGTLDVTMESGSTDNSVSISSVNNSTSASATYTVLSGDSNGDLYVKTLAVSGGYLIDVAGNPMSVADLSIPSGNNMDDSKNIEIDGIDPSNFTVGNVTTTGGNIYTGYWNSTNTGLNVVVPISNDTSLTNGTVQLRGKVNSGIYENLGSVVTIGLSDLNTNNTISISSAEFETLNNFTDDAVITINAVIKDEAGNSTTGTASSTTLVVDQTDPATFTVDTVYSVGNVVVANFYNGVNTGIDVKIPFSGQDNTITGGKIRLQAKTAGVNSWENVADFSMILGSDFTTGYKIVSVDSGGTDSTDLHDLIGFTEGEILSFNAIIWDIAGNQRTGTENTISMVVDTARPTISSISSSSLNGSYKSGTSINLDFTASEVINVTGTPQIQLETGNFDATVDYSSGSATNIITFVYTVADGHTSSDLDVRNSSSLSLNNGTIRDNAGNNLVLTLPAPGAAGSLSDNNEIIIDTDAPTAVISYSDSLVKEYDLVTITATFSETMVTDPDPQVAILYAGGTELDTVIMSQANDTVWVKTITIPPGNDGAATVSIIAEDLAGNPLTNVNTTNRSLMRVDNTPPTFSLLSPDSGAYVNHTLVGYKLSETSFSGTIKWTKVGGTVSDTNSPHNVTLSSTELDAATTFSDYTLPNAPTNLVSGVNYRVTWSATDSAGNVSADFISEPVFYDTTAPAVALTYSKYIASADTIVQITAQFDERVLPTPQIAINYAGVGDDVLATNMTMGDDSTVWTYDAIIPQGEINNGIASVSITATDMAQNALRSGDVTYGDTLVVDNTVPTAVISYSDSLVKENNVVTITVTFSEEMSILPKPNVSIDYTGDGNDIVALDMINLNDTVWTQTVTIPPGNDGAATVSIIAEDLAGNPLTNVNTTNRSLMRVDNTPPTFSLLSPDSGAYVNHTLVGYKLSETSFSGYVRWASVGGLYDIDHTVTLSTAELDAATTFSDYTLTNMPTNLVSGSIYRITWSATDSAGNVSADFISTPVHYDTTAPTVDLTYSKYIVSADTVVTITAQFDENVVDPQIEITYGVDNVSATTMTIGSDSTIWTYADTIPSGIGNEDTATVLITTVDLATNALRSSDISNSDTLFVDNTEPTITFSYENLSQTHLTNEGKYGDAVGITAQFSERADVNNPPKLNIEYSDSTNDSFVNLSADSTNNDSIWFYSVSLPDGSNNDGIFTASLTAKDVAGNPVSTFNNYQAFTVDNTPPDDFVTDSVFTYGNNPILGWINGTTDTIQVMLTLPGPTGPNGDPSIYTGGRVDIQMNNINRSGGWFTIGSSDSISTGGRQAFYRGITAIKTQFVPNINLMQGDSLLTRAMITDRVGNTTNGDSSTTILIYDPYAPNLGVVTGGIFFTKDTVVSSDSLSATWSTFTDSVSQSNPGSGLSFYEYKIQYYNASGVYVDTLKGWTLIGTSETVTNTNLALTHDNLYSFHVRATDVAGNISEIMNSDTIRRINSAPIIVAITDTIQSFEDIPFTQTIAFTDADTATLSGDSFTYGLTTTHQYGHTPASPAVFLTGQNVIDWTPTQSDTGLYTVEVIVNDNWTFSDTIIYQLFVNAVNDTPTVAILNPYDNQTMQEDQIAISKFLLSTYGNDVDNDSTQLTWQAAVWDTSGKPGFPTSAALFFGNGTPEIVKQRLIDQYQPQQSYKVIKPLKETKDKSSEIRSVNSPNVRYKNSLANYIQVALTDTNGVWWAEFQVDSNYYGANHRIVFYISDPDGATSQDTILLTINPENDPPVISLIPRFEVTENQFLKLDFADYVSDVDDTTLTVRVSALTNHNKMALAAPNVGATTVGDSLQYLITDFGDTVIFTPEIEWSDTSLIQLSVIDGQSARASKTFVIDIIRVPRPNLSLEVIQNNAFTNFFEVVITDTISKTDSLFITVQGQRIPLDTVAAYTYVGHYSFDNSGTYSFYAKAWGVVGDTTITRSVFMAQAKAHYDWTGFSPDGNFRVFGTSGAVPYDQGLLIVDSTMFNAHFNDRASYRLGKESKRFEIPVEVSFLSTNDIFAIYQRVNGVEWVELPSITKGGQIVAYTDGMGYFRLGPKTIIVPGETSLRQNYPNPFNPVTNIIYDVGFNEGPRQKVNVVVYNLLGQHVATLVNEYKNIGRYTTRWDGKDQHGVPVSSGIYFVRLMNDHGRIYTKKMMLIR